MVWHLPHIHAIAATTRSGRVDILTKPRSLADRLLDADPSVERVFWLERESGRHAGASGVMRLVALLRQGLYQRVWLLHDSARYALAAWLAGIPERIGYGLGLQRLLLNVPVRLPASYRLAQPMVRADALLALLAIPQSESEPRLVVSDAAVSYTHLDVYKRQVSRDQPEASLAEQIAERILPGWRRIAIAFHHQTVPDGKVEQGPQRPAAISALALPLDQASHRRRLEPGSNTR